MPKIDRHASFDKANDAWEAGDEKEAFKLFMKAAKEGDIYALNSIGYFFDLGIGVPKNKKKALFWYKRAAREGDVAAHSNIGTLYRDDGNFRLARFWFLKAFKGGDGDAALELAKLHQNRNEKVDIAHASRYLHLAIKSRSITEDSVDEANALLRKIERHKATKRTGKKR